MEGYMMKSKNKCEKLGFKHAWKQGFSELEVPSLDEKKHFRCQNCSLKKIEFIIHKVQYSDGKERHEA